MKGTVSWNVVAWCRGTYTEHRWIFMVEIGDSGLANEIIIRFDIAIFMVRVPKHNSEKEL